LERDPSNINSQIIVPTNHHLYIINFPKYLQNYQKKINQNHPYMNIYWNYNVLLLELECY